LGFWMAARRGRAIRSGGGRPRDIALREPNWPKQLMQLQNALSNQLELPVLFYVLTILALFTQTADLAFVALARPYVALPLGRADLHLAHNRVPRPGLVFIPPNHLLCGRWVAFAVRLLV